jgi:hypothetical protein
MATDPEATYASDNTTLVAIIDGFEADGYASQAVVVDDGVLKCTTCHELSNASEWSVDALRRVEGASDTADMAAVIALRCPECGAKATVVLPFGPDSSPEDADVLATLTADTSLPAKLH